MQPAGSSTAAIPVVLALLGALALPESERERVSLEDIVIPDPPAAVRNLAGDDDTLAICSFNIQFLGNSTRRDDVTLAAIVQEFDIVLVQELVSPPYPGTFPGGKAFKPDAESAEFFDLMVALGFEYVLSNEDTGSGATNHKNGSATEWWVAFYQPDRVQVAEGLPGGFLANDRTDHDDYERVPYAFPFRTSDNAMDFVLISVHLQPGSSKKNKKRRAHELRSIAKWINRNDASEKDFIIVGDMNLEDSDELAAATPDNFLSLNDEVVATNTSTRKKPYDHVMYNRTVSQEVDEDFDFAVIDLVDVAQGFWTRSDQYPGDPYNHNKFRAFFSDHHPVVFRMDIPEVDDD